MAIDISSIIQNHLTAEAVALEEGAVVEEGATVETTGINFEAAVDSMGSASAGLAIEEDTEMFMSETEIQAVRGAIVSGIIATQV